MNRLRRQSDVAHHGNIDGGDSRHRFGYRDAAFQLHRLGAAFLDQTARVAQRVFGTYLIRQERHVGDDQRPASRAHHRPSVVDDLVDSDGQRVGLAAHRHGETIADQQQIDAAVVEDSREWKVVRSQHRDRLPRGLHAREIGHANFVLRHIVFRTLRCSKKKRGLPRTSEKQTPHQSKLDGTSARITRSPSPNIGSRREQTPNVIASTREAFNSTPSRREKYSSTGEIKKI